MKFKESMIIEYGSYSTHYICPKCVVDFAKNEGAFECFRSIIIYHSEERAKMDGWKKIRGESVEYWICPKCAKGDSNES